MSRTDREDAAAKALDILPPNDEARSDPRLLRVPELTEEARLTREAAADVWLAVSPLRAAPPDVLHAVMAKIDAKPKAAAERRRYAPWIAASGWAAAAAVAIGLWPRTDSLEVPAPALSGASDAKRVPESLPAAEVRPRVSYSLGPDREERRLRSELMKLRGSLARLSDDALLTAPRVMSLSSPGGAERSPEETRERVWAVLTGALRSALEAESGAPNDPAALVIERGWLPDGVTAPEDGGVIRHRNFPESAWEELGLLRSDDGSYYDPQKELVWTRDEEGRGFIGRKATEGDDLDNFRPAGEGPAIAVNEARREPEGFVIEDPVTNKAEVVIDQVPPPAEGMEQLVVWTDAAGAENTIKLATAQTSCPEASGSASPVPNGGSAAPLVFPSHRGKGPSGAPGQMRKASNTIVFSIPNSQGVKSFRLIEASIVPNGRPFRVIVQGGN